MAKSLLGFPFISLRGIACNNGAKLPHNSLAQIQSRCKHTIQKTVDVNQWNGERFEEPRPHMETPIYPNQYTGAAPPKGVQYDKKPFRMEIQAGKVYEWCSCGLSRTQPFCDKTHMYEEGNSRKKVKPMFRPVKYVAKETKVVYFCNCKQTSNRPFCDNTHKQEHIADAYTFFKN